MGWYTMSDAQVITQDQDIMKYWKRLSRFGGTLYLHVGNASESELSLLEMGILADVLGERGLGGSYEVTDKLGSAFAGNNPYQVLFLLDVMARLEPTGRKRLYTTTGLAMAEDMMVEGYPRSGRELASMACLYAGLSACDAKPSAVPDGWRDSVGSAVGLLPRMLPEMIDSLLGAGKYPLALHLFTKAAEYTSSPADQAIAQAGHRIGIYLVSHGMAKMDRIARQVADLRELAYGYRTGGS